MGCLVFCVEKKEGESVVIHQCRCRFISPCPGLTDLRVWQKWMNEWSSEMGTRQGKGREASKKLPLPFVFCGSFLSFVRLRVIWSVYWTKVCRGSLTLTRVKSLPHSLSSFWSGSNTWKDFQLRDLTFCHAVSSSRGHCNGRNIIY